ncbi:MAG: HU family DNA-binding protein [Sulfurovum sp.]|nr:HU family DNA-binding protein [Sulfurovaceae bacterium]
MTKAEFIELIKEMGDYKSKTEAEKAIKAFTGAVTKVLVDKKSISLVGFGTFSTIEVAEKSGKVPNKDAIYTKPAHTAPKFKIGKTLKDAVANA